MDGAIDRLAVLAGRLGHVNTQENMNEFRTAIDKEVKLMVDAGLAALREGLAGAGVWRDSVVVVASEFGREVAINGTQGSDHGTGGAAFVLGGAIRGGRVLADWPGLAKKDRFEGRDLRITTDLRAVWRCILDQHLQVGRAALDTQVLPGTADLPRLDLLRA